VTLDKLLPKDKYQYGTLNNMLAAWKEKERDYAGKFTAAELTKKWQTFVRNYVKGVDSNARGKAYERYVFGKQRILGSADYQFDEQLPYAAVRPDAFPKDPARLGRGFEVKDTRVLTPRSREQLKAYIDAVNASNTQIVYAFRVRPMPATLRAIDEANKATKFNQGLKPGAKPAPAIVVRILPAVPQPIPIKEDLPSAGPTATGTGGGNAGGTAGPRAPVPPKGGGGLMTAPGSGQLPVDGALDDAIADSPDTAADAAADAEVLNELGGALGNEDIGGTDPLGGVDFSTLELRYVSDTYQGGSGLQYAFNAQPTPDEQASYGGRRAAQLASDAFFVWMALPTSAFTVNLGPDEPDRIMESRFGTTDAGRVLLEADLQMKKTVAKLIHPDSPTGAQFWSALRGESKCLSMRQWIVPAPASVREDNGQLYILNAPLEVKLETDYARAAGVGGVSGCPGQSDSETKFNEQLFRTTILPKVSFAVNYAPEYADLRRVYVSRVAAQWYRERSATKHTAYSDVVNSGDVTSWPARTAWSPKEVWERYVSSYKNGEFKVTRKSQQGNVVTTETYVYGGVDLTNIPRLKLSDKSFTSLHAKLPATVSQAAYRPTNEDGGKRLWLGGLSTPRPLPEILAGVPSPTSRATFWVAAMLPLLLWVAGGALLLVRRQRAVRS
jgi:hypothetical protein